MKTGCHSSAFIVLPVPTVEFMRWRQISEAFWVALATVCPVIVVGYLVAFERLIRFRPIPERRPRKTLTFQSVEGPRTYSIRRRFKDPAFNFVGIVVTAGIPAPLALSRARKARMPDERLNDRGWVEHSHGVYGYDHYGVRNTARGVDRYRLNRPHPSSHHKGDAQIAGTANHWRKTIRAL